MKTPAAITPATITFAVTIIGSWLKIDQFNTELIFIEQAGISNEEVRRYDLLKFGVERMSQQLLELGK